MKGSTLPGTVQIRVITDKQDAEDFSRKLSGFLRSNGMIVIDLTSDFPDKFDPENRVKFHISAVPKAGTPRNRREISDETKR
jgi:hypothetical protein